MVKDEAAAIRKLKRLLKDASPTPQQEVQESRRLADFRQSKQKFGAKGMTSTLGSLAWDSSRRAVSAASNGDLLTAEAELGEGFRRAYWSYAIVQKAVPSTLSAVLLQAFVRGSGAATLVDILRRELEPGDPHRLFGFATWALQLIGWDGSIPLWDGSPYFEQGVQLSNQTAPESMLQAMCIWHLQVAQREAGFSPFYFTPYTILPVEVFAWAKKREELGLGVPTLNHPLLTNPVAKIPLPKIDLAPKGHELIEPLLARCVKEGVLTAEQIAAMSK